MDVVSDAISAVHLGHPWSHRVRSDGDWRERVEPFQGAGFYVVLKGSCLLLTDSGARISLDAGDAVLLPHGAGHVIEGAGTEVLCGRYWLDCSRMHPLMTELPEVVHLPNRIGHHLELRAAIDLLAGELDRIKPGSCVALPNLLDLLLVYLVRSYLDEATGGTWPGALGDSVTAAALRAMHADPAAPWSNDRLAAEAGVSRATLARRFTALVGRAPMAYLTWWRLIVAAGMLRDTPDTLAAIAGRVGYGSPYALSHAFEREFGTTPGRYRAQAAERSAERGPAAPLVPGSTGPGG